MNGLLQLPPALLVLAAAALVPLLSRRVGSAVAGGSLALVVAWALAVPAGVGPTTTFLGFELRVVRVDAVTRLVTLVFGGFGLAAVGYAHLSGMGRIRLTCALVYAAAALWTVTVGDWLSLIVGWELLAVSATLLLWLDRGPAVRAGYRYALAHAIGGTALLVGLAIHTSSVGPAPDALWFGDGIAPGLAAAGVGIGIAVNAAVIGVHAWLPDSYARPHVASSVFLCAYTTKVAVYTAHRAFPDGNLLLAYAGGAMAVYGAGYALAQSDMRRLLAYHIQAQVGYMLAGVGIGGALGVAGGFAHLFNNVLYKGLLFMLAGIVLLRLKEERLDHFGALGATMPVVLAAFTVAALSIAGMPGTNGFVSKELVFAAADDAGARPLYWLLLAGSVGTAASFAKFGYYAFLDGEPPDRGIPEGVASGRAYAALTLPLAGCCLLFGLRYDLLFALLPAAGTWSVDPYATGTVLEKLALGAVGAVAFLVSKPLLKRLEGGTDVDALHDPLALYGTRAVSGALAWGFERADRLAAVVAARVEGLTRGAEAPIRTVLPVWLRGEDGELSATLAIGPSVALVLAVLAASLLVALAV
ncbi:proton-conducting transporter membrane subunit [Halalkalicoccus tibetensis]|uniref:Proton-conducting transporter membrane subunit n=1 Tax=Halalkalicoccus tibetensis TaxID=175632 RepID=A0ABD5V142_9EURY